MGNGSDTIANGTQAYLEVAERIEQWILSGKLKPGRKLPGERDLCEQLGVSRPVVRESLHILHERGLIARSEKRGHFVSSINWEPIRRSFVLFSQRAVVSVREVLELRQFIEVPAARLAALRRTPAHIKQLRTLLDEMEENLANLKDALTQDPDLNVHSEATERHIELDIQFHSGIARASQNLLIPPVLGSLAELIKRYMYLDLRRSSGRVVATEFHRKILECIEDGDADGAEQAMTEHLSYFSGGASDIAGPIA